MAVFPHKEADVVDLAQAMIDGLRAHPAMFPHSPVSPDVLAQLLAAFMAAQEAHVAAQKAVRQAIADKNAALQELAKGTKHVLRYAENTVGNDHVKLKLLGWGGKAKPRKLQPPGQPGPLTAPSQGHGWIQLRWRKPSRGGKVAVYRIERRDRRTDAWHNIAGAVHQEILLVDQPSMQELEYRVVAMNKAGESGASNVVDAIM